MFFLLGFERDAVRWWALGFLLLSEVVMLSGLITLQFVKPKHSKAFLHMGISTVLFFYFVTTLVSVLFSGLLSGRINTFIVIELVIIAFYAITIVSIAAFSRAIKRRNEEDMAKVGSIEPKRGGF